MNIGFGGALEGKRGGGGGGGKWKKLAEEGNLRKENEMLGIRERERERQERNFMHAVQEIFHEISCGVMDSLGVWAVLQHSVEESVVSSNSLSRSFPS